jgi:modulator of FtsH protease
MERYPNQVVHSVSSAAVLSTNKVLRNTYLLLGMTLGFSAVMAAVSMVISFPFLGLFMLIPYFALLYAVHKTANSSWGLFWTFAFTGYMGLTLGPILSAYLTHLTNGGQIIATALGTTAAAFVGLSAYSVISRRDFSFMRGFLVVGIIGAFVLGIIAYLFKLSTTGVVASAMFLLVSGGIMLYQTSEIVRGGETNYIRATVILYVAIYNMFASLLHLLGFASNE